MRADIFGLIDDTHPPSAQLFHDAVVGDGLPTSWEGIAIGGNLRLNVLQGQQRSIPGASGTSGTDRSTKAGLLSFRGDFSEYWVPRGKLFPKIGILKLGSLNSHVGFVEPAASFDPHVTPSRGRHCPLPSLAAHASVMPITTPH